MGLTRSELLKGSLAVAGIMVLGPSCGDDGDDGPGDGGAAGNAGSTAKAGGSADAGAPSEGGTPGVGGTGGSSGEGGTISDAGEGGTFSDGGLGPSDAGEGGVSPGGSGGQGGKAADSGFCTTEVGVVANHTHALNFSLDSIDPSSPLTFTTSVVNGHSHRVALTPGNLLALGRGETVETISTVDDGHDHPVSITCSG